MSRFFMVHCVLYGNNCSCYTVTAEMINFIHRQQWCVDKWN